MYNRVPTSNAERDYMRAYAKAMTEYIGPCPWNPFPRTSPWGRMVDDAYRRSEEQRRARSRLP